MRWIATAVVSWGAVLWATGAPVAGVALTIVGAIAFAALTVQAARRDPVRARAERASAGADPVPAAVLEQWSGPVARPARTSEESDRLLVELYWNFRRIDDVAMLAECCPERTQSRLIELLLDPSGPVEATGSEPRIPLAERAELVRAFAAGAPLAVLAARAGRSEYAVGRVLLEHAEQPVGLTV